MSYGRGARGLVRGPAGLPRSFWVFAVGVVGLALVMAVVG